MTYSFQIEGTFYKSFNSLLFTVLLPTYLTTKLKLKHHLVIDCLITLARGYSPCVTVPNSDFANLFSTFFSHQHEIWQHQQDLVTKHFFTVTPRQ